MKSEGTTLEGKWKVICKMQMKSHFSHIGKRNGNCCPYRRKHFHYFLKEIRRRCPLAPSSSSLARLGFGLFGWVWTDMFLAENGYKRKSIFDFLITENFSFSAFIFSLKIKSKCRSTEFVWLVAVLQFVEVKEVGGTDYFFNRFNPFYLGRN